MPRFSKKRKSFKGGEFPHGNVMELRIIHVYNFNNEGPYKSDPILFKKAIRNVMLHVHPTSFRHLRDLDNFIKSNRAELTQLMIQEYKRMYDEQAQSEDSEKPPIIVRDDDELADMFGKLSTKKVNPKTYRKSKRKLYTKTPYRKSIKKQTNMATRRGTRIFG
jgi:hypothetical protein